MPNTAFTRNALRLATVLSGLSCDAAQPEPAAPDSGGGKADSGYVSSAALEINARLTGTIVLSLDSAERAQEFVDNIESCVTYSSSSEEAWGDSEGPANGDTGAGESGNGQDPATGYRCPFIVSSVISAQADYALTQLDRAKLNINLSAGVSKLVKSEALTNGQVSLEYIIDTESVVSRVFLETEGIDIESLLKNPITAEVPADPTSVYEYGEKCASDGSDGSVLEEYNYYFYFDPNKAGCDAPTVTLRLQTELIDKGQRPVYPEYDRLAQDGKITTVVFFNAEDSAEALRDPGNQEWWQFSNVLRNKGFKVEGVVELKGGEIDFYQADPAIPEKGLSLGVRYRRVRGGLEELIDVFSPKAVAKAEQTSLFTAYLQTTEIIVYDGHAGYGGMNVLEQGEAYTPDFYQIIFMNACWSYSYYTSQVFQHKATDEDPHGWNDADVVNNTKVAWFHNMADVTDALLANLFRGAETGGREQRNGKTVDYSWLAITEAMNRIAVNTWGVLTKNGGITEDQISEGHELYGVSGVTTNRYRPRP